MTSIARLSRAATLTARSIAGGFSATALWLVLAYAPAVKSAGKPPAGAYFGAAALLVLAFGFARAYVRALRTEFYRDHVRQRQLGRTVELRWQEASHFEVRGYQVVVYGAAGSVTIPCWLYRDSDRLLQAIVAAVRSRGDLLV